MIVSVFFLNLNIGGLENDELSEGPLCSSEFSIFMEVSFAMEDFDLHQN